MIDLFILSSEGLGVVETEMNHGGKCDTAKGQLETEEMASIGQTSSYPSEADGCVVDKTDSAQTNKKPSSGMATANVEGWKTIGTGIHKGTALLVINNVRGLSD